MRAQKSGHGMEGLECWLPLCASEEIQGLERHAFHQVPLVVHGGRLASRWELRSLKPLSSPWTQRSWHDEVPKRHDQPPPVPHRKSRMPLDIIQASLVKERNQQRNSGQH